MSGCENCNKCDNIITFNNNKFEYNESLSYPHAAIMSLTDDCTNRCPYCFVKFGTKRMTLDTARQTVKYISTNAGLKNQTPDITFFGGEPLMEFETIMVPLVKEFPDIKYSITTNGVLLTKEVVDFLVEYNIPVLLSLDGDKKTQDRERPLADGGSSFDKIILNLPYAIQKLGGNIVMRSTVTKASIPELYDNFIFAQKQGFQSWSFIMNAFEEYDDNDYNILFSQIEEICHDIAVSLLSGNSIIKVNTIIEFFNKISNIKKFSEIVINNQLTKCGLATTGTGISPEGLIIPCQEQNSKIEYSIGNIWDGIDFKLHEEFLLNYFNTVKQIKCELQCSKKIKQICLNSFCNSRLLQINSKSNIISPFTSQCIVNKSFYQNVSRLYLLFNNHPNNYISKFYFNQEENHENS